MSDKKDLTKDFKQIEVNEAPESLDEYMLQNKVKSRHLKHEFIENTKSIFKGLAPYILKLKGSDPITAMAQQDNLLDELNSQAFIYVFVLETYLAPMRREIGGNTVFDYEWFDPTWVSGIADCKQGKILDYRYTPQFIATDQIIGVSQIKIKGFNDD